MPPCQEPFLSPGCRQAAMSHTNSAISSPGVNTDWFILFIVSINEDTLFLSLSCINTEELYPAKLPCLNGGAQP